MTLAKLLNQEVANLGILFVKLHHFHWYVKGPNFFALHSKFEEIYDEINELYDAVAERLLTLGGAPASTLKEYLALSTIKEATANQTALDMVKSLHGDLTQLVSEFNEALKLAQSSGDEATADMLINAIANFEKTNWMLKATLA